MSAARTIVVGDVHGCLEELDELLALLAPVPGRDRLVFLGDLLDRGPDSVGVLRRVRERGAECLLGNHEEKHLRWASHRARRAADPHYRIPMKLARERKRDHERFSPDDLAWLARLPRWLSLGDGWVAVHGGLLPGLAPAEQDPEVLVRLRFIDGAGGMVPRWAPIPRDARRWAEAWRGPHSVVYGHHVQEDGRPRFDVPAPGVTCAGLDTGCVYGGRLSALLLPAGEVVQVAARRAWAPPTGQQARAD